MTLYLPLALLSAGALLFEIGLTRLFSVAQFYHFAFMLVSLALLGLSVGGTLLASVPGLARRLARRYSLACLAAGFALTVPGSYLVLNHFPFDSFSIAWDAMQIGRLAVNFLAVAVPFSLVGVVVGALLATRPEHSHRLYGANLLGSALGSGLALIVPAWIGGEGVVLGSAWLGALAAVTLLQVGRGKRSDAGVRHSAKTTLRFHSYPFFLLLLALTIGLIWPPDLLRLRLSEYKPLARMRLLPDARQTVKRWSSATRVDVVESGSIRILPGISFAYQNPPPVQAAIFTDGDAPSPISRLDLEDPRTLALAGNLPASLAYELRPAAQALVIEPGGGLDVTVALAQGAERVAVTHREALIPSVLRIDYGDFAAGLYSDRRVTVITEDIRAFLQRSAARYDVIQLALTDPNRPITSGAYSLVENYSLTVEAMLAYLEHLAPGGMFVVSRWLQSPPSESLRVYGLALGALEQLPGTVPVERQVVALRGFQSATFLVQPDGFNDEEWARVRDFARSRRFDLVAGPGLMERHSNQYSVLTEPAYLRSLAALRTAPDREAFYASYQFDVRPPTDNQPYFFHFFKWRQIPAVLQTLGQTWQPFGGSGYFVLLLLLGMATVLAVGLVVLPVVLSRAKARPHSGVIGRQGVHPRWGAAAALYFAAVGLGFLLVEVPLVQRYSLFLGRPVYALALVIGGLLAFSGLGSLTARHWPLPLPLVLLCVLIAFYPVGLQALFVAALHLSLAGRMVVALLSLAPLGLLLGIPFAAGLLRLEHGAAQLIPWAWAINGGASVVSALLAPLLALSYGFRAVLLAGALAYSGALLTTLVNGTKRTSRMR